MPGNFGMTFRRPDLAVDVEEQIKKLGGVGYVRYRPGWPCTELADCHGILDVEVLMGYSWRRVARQVKRLLRPMAPRILWRASRRSIRAHRPHFPRF